MPLTARFMMMVFALLPLWLSVEGLLSGWISPPMGKPRTRRFQPVQYWTVILTFAALGILLIVTALLL